MLGLAPSCESKKTGEGEKAILAWCTKGAEPDPFSPRIHYLFEKINAVMARKDITGEEKTKLLKEVKACGHLPPDFDKFVRVDEEDMDKEEEDEDMDEIYTIRSHINSREIPDEELMKFLEETDEEEDMEEDEGSEEVEGDGEMGNVLQLGDQEKPGILKRPQSSFVKSEMECKKPRVAQVLGFPGVPVAAEM